MHEKTSRSTPSLPDLTEDDAPRGRTPPGLALDPPAPEPSHPPEIEVERLDPDALKVIYRLRHVGHRAYFVGGCVRDLLLDAKPKDFDVATDAHPGEVRAVFRNCRLIGRRFRLAHVYFRGGKVVEVATFRKNPTDIADDVPSDDGDLLITRDNVFGTAEEDAVRRDFTVNGLFYDVSTGEVIDYVGGRADLEAHRIATIGDPEIRMREDPVRALRAVRFASRLGFTIAPDTFEAMRRHAGELARCAPARVLEETFKLLRCGGAARAFELLRASGALPVVLPALAAALDAWEETRRRAFFAHLAALDRLVRSGEEVSEAVLLGALIMHLRSAHAPAPAAAAPAEDALPAEGEAAPPRPARDAAEALLTGLVQSARLPRRVAERTRLALHALRTFRDPPRRRRRRGRGLAGQPYFEDALQLLRITVEATGEGGEVLERWKAEGGAQAGHHEDGRAHADRRPHGEPAGPPPHREREREHGADGRAKASRRVVRAAREVGTGGHEVHGVPVIEIDAVAPRAPAAHAGSEPGAGERAEPGRRRRRRRGGRRRGRRGPGSPGEGKGGPPTPAAGGAS